ncbi:hypothetical protein N7512_000418 [Penicillium capsulatum]|nr:hypothetical protein N7512_000418 [Penicillium capsulatum]
MITGNRDTMALSEAQIEGEFRPRKSLDESASGTALMTGKRQKKQSYHPPKGGAASHEVATKPEPHSAPATPTRPSLEAVSARGGKGTKSTPSLGEVGASGNAKVAIPRQPPVNAPRYHRRVPRAEVDRLNAQVQDYECLMSAMKEAAESRGADWVNVLIEKHGRGDDGLDNPRSLLSTPQIEPEADDPSPLSSIGSLEAIDRVDEDLNRTKHTRATGFMGKSSEISWMQRLQREAEQRFRGYPGPLEPNEYDEETKDRYSLHSLNYHLDDLEISVSEPVQLYSMPPRQLADRLFDDYLSSTFFDTSQTNATRPGDKWLAILNIIFAIAAKHAHLMHAPWRGEEDDHLVYLARARLLSMNGEVLFSHPDLQQVQVEGLIAFYLLASDQINRAWRISALAVRSAITLGINLKNNSPRTTDIAKEARYRVWWCLYNFEHMLGIMTGRAIYSLDGGYATPLPLPFEEDQLQNDSMAIKLLKDSALRDELVSTVMASAWIRQTGSKDDTRRRDQRWLKRLSANSGLCFLYYCDLTVITQEIMNKVYSTNAVTLLWSEIEGRLDELRSRIDQWQSGLPVALDFTQDENDNGSTQRFKLSPMSVPARCATTQLPQSFSHMMAVIALDSASNMLSLIPDKPDIHQLYQVCPWWCVLRYLMQAATVILLELSFGSVHKPEDEDEFVKLSKKSIRWFAAMSERSIGSRRAWQLCDSSFRKLASSMEYSTDDIPSSPRPQRRATVNPAFVTDYRPIDASSREYFNLPLDDMTVFGQNLVPDEDIYTNYFNLPTPDLMSSLQGPPGLMDDSYFPYDPLSGEFLRSLFPSFQEDNRERN